MRDFIVFSSIVLMTCLFCAYPAQMYVTDAPTSTSDEDINCNVGADCLRQLLNSSHWYHMIGASGLVLEDLGNYAACKAQDDMHMCIADFSIFAQGICIPEQCDATILGELWKMISWSNKTVEQYMDRCAKPIWDNFCKNQFPHPQQRLECDREFHVVEYIVVDYWELLEQLTSNFTGLEFHCGNHTPTQIDPQAIIMLLVIVSPIILMIARAWVATVRSRKRHSYQPITPDASTPIIQAEETKSFDFEEKAKAPAWLEAFNPSKSFEVLTGTGGSRSMKCLDGIRTISMLWVILGHTLNFQFNQFVGFSNYEILYYELQQLSIQIFDSAPFSVDSFFFLSGLLTTYVTLRRYFRTKKLPPIYLSVLMRWLRILPLYAFVVGLYACVVPYLGGGPLWYKMIDETSKCDAAWWPHFLFINNFYPTDYDKQCLPWAWYLANDMQFFIIGICIIYIYPKSPFISTSLAGLFVIGSMVANGWLAHAYHYNPADSLQDVVYDKPYTRFGPYGIGLIYGIILVKYEDKIKQLSMWFSLTLMTIGIAGIFGIVYATADFNWNPKDPNWSPIENIMYLVFTRACWGLGLAMIITACLSGHGYFVNWILSRPFWQIFGRLTFGAYLIHPAFIRFIYYQRVSVFYYNWSETTLHYLAFLFAAYLIALLLFIGVEQPTANLTQLLVPKSKSRTKKTGGPITDADKTTPPQSP